MLNPNYNKTITLWNCLKAVDNPDKVDAWYKTEIPECFFKVLQTQVTSGTSASMAGTYTARIPASDKYLKYEEWCKLPALTRGNYFTGSVGDIIILGSFSETITNVSPNASANVLGRAKPNAFKVTAFSDNSDSIQGHYRFGG